MDTQKQSQKWQQESEAVFTQIAKWRQEHPHATMAQIEQAVDEHMNTLRAQVLQDTAQASPIQEQQESAVHKPRCLCRCRIRPLAMLKEYTLIPVIDTVRINGQGDSEEVSLPLFSCLEEEGLSRFFFEYQRRIEKWGQSLTEFLGVYGIEWDGEQKKWHLT